MGDTFAPDAVVYEQARRAAGPLADRSGQAQRVHAHRYGEQCVEDCVTIHPLAPAGAVTGDACTHPPLAEGELETDAGASGQPGDVVEPPVEPPTPEEGS